MLKRNQCALRDGSVWCIARQLKLSNQKFQDLRLKFGSRVGLITGDVTLEEDSPCLVMTTEILRGVLYRGSTLMRELKWLIIDEVHLLGDGARGWVIETLILLPQTVRFVLLSATVPNVIDISEWVTTLHRTPCHVALAASADTARHYAYGAGGDGLYLVLNEGGHFDGERGTRQWARCHTPRLASAENRRLWPPAPTAAHGNYAPPASLPCRPTLCGA